MYALYLELYDLHHGSTYSVFWYRSEVSWSWSIVWSIVIYLNIVIYSALILSFVLCYTSRSVLPYLWPTSRVNLSCLLALVRRTAIYATWMSRPSSMPFSKPKKCATQRVAWLEVKREKRVFIVEIFYFDCMSSSTIILQRSIWHDQENEPDSSIQCMWHNMGDKNKKAPCIVWDKMRPWVHGP